MEPKRGYLVVSTDPTHIAAVDPGYRGLYRTPPFDQTKFNDGFDDPYISDEFVNQDGLIPDIAAADAVWKRFASVMSPEHLELLWVETGDGSSVPTESVDGEYLGYDVACLAPFWSIVADPARDVFMPELNKHGLIGSYEAAEVLRRTFSELPDGRDLDVYIWDVWRLPNR
jgi:hypothetical protein